MVVEAAMVIEDDKNSPSNASVLQQLVVLLLEKTHNLELIQATYERDMDVMRQKIKDHETTIRLLSAQVEELSAKFGYSSKLEQSHLVPSSEMGGCSSQTSEELISPGLSSSLQDVFNQLEFLNDKSIKLESISSYSDEKRSSSLQSLHSNDEDLARDVEAEEEALTKTTPILVTTLSYDNSTYNDSTNQPGCNGNDNVEEANVEEELLTEVQAEEETQIKTTPILVTALSYDTSTYNDSTNQSDITEEELEDVHAEEELVSQVESTPPMASLPAKDIAPPTIKSMKKKGIVTQTLVTKIPIVLQENSADENNDKEDESVAEQEHEHEESDDVFDETSLSKSNEAMTDATESTDHRRNFPWTRSDTFDVIPESQSSQIAVPVKPKRGIVSPLQSLRHPTERDDTIGDLTQVEKAPLQRLPAENTEHLSDHSTFSQVSSNRSSSFEYEIQYIMPQVLEGDALAKPEETTESSLKTDKDTSFSEAMDSESPSKMTEDGEQFNFENADVTVKVSKASNSENEDDILTPQ